MFLCNFHVAHWKLIKSCFWMLLLCCVAVMLFESCYFRPSLKSHKPFFIHLFIVHAICSQNCLVYYLIYGYWKVLKMRNECDNYVLALSACTLRQAGHCCEIQYYYRATFVCCAIFGVRRLLVFFVLLSHFSEARKKFKCSNRWAKMSNVICVWPPSMSPSTLPSACLSRRLG